MQLLHNALYVDKVAVLSPIIFASQEAARWLSFVLLADACQWQAIVISYAFIYIRWKLLQFLVCYDNKIVCLIAVFTVMTLE